MASPPPPLDDVESPADAAVAAAAPESPSSPCMDNAQAALLAEAEGSGSPSSPKGKKITFFIYLLHTGERVCVFTLRPSTPVTELGHLIGIATERSRLAAWPCRAKMTLREKMDVVINEDHTLEGAGIYEGAHVMADMFPAIVTASTDKTARVWNGDTGRCERILKGHTEPLYSAAFSPDGRLVATASEDCTMRLWMCVTGECWRVCKGHTDAVFAAVWSPDSKLVATASGDHTARIWGAKNGETLHVLRGHTAPVFSCVFSPDGRTLTTSSRDNMLKEWNPRTGSLDRTSEKATAPVYTASCSPYGRYAVTCPGDWNAHIVDTTVNDCVRLLEGHEGIVVAASYGPEGSACIPASKGTTVKPTHQMKTLSRSTCSAAAREKEARQASEPAEASAAS
eukprot:TRINITY_DN15681_c0_g1_i1.p1 TRINITY_DN15681_c0_g1~~TRINITY_DN15681_c0_g1_i1.p1  ORF type:complete len:397 (+),score=82.71 TRINITY_DN15681_c0_g1_i1:60-1250(+)